MNKNREAILKESFNYKGHYLEENIFLKNLASSYFSDKKVFEEETLNLYSQIFGKDIESILKEMELKEEKVFSLIEKDSIYFVEDVGFGGIVGRAAANAANLATGAGQGLGIAGAGAANVSTAAAGKALSGGLGAVARNLAKKPGFLQNLFHSANPLGALTPMVGIVAARIIFRLLKKIFARKQQQQPKPQ